MLEHLTFNRGGFALLLLLSIRFGFKGFKEWKQTKEDRSQTEGDSEGSRPPPIA